MDSIAQRLRQRAASFSRWLRGRETEHQHQRQRIEQNVPNGLIRQTQDPDYTLAQRTFGRLAERTEPQRQRPAAMLARIDALQRQLQTEERQRQDQARRERNHSAD